MTRTEVFSAHLPGTPVGTLKLWATRDGLRRLDFRTGPDLAHPGEQLSSEPHPPLLDAALEALRGYFDGRVRTFDIPLDLGGVTDFQQSVYDHLVSIPFGRVTSYGDVARALELGDAGARAVGGAVGSNPVAIVIPCHRVVGSDGALHGFSGGLRRKAALLRHEGIVVDGDTATSKVHPEILRLPL